MSEYSLPSCCDVSRMKCFKVFSDLDANLYSQMRNGNKIKPIPFVYKKIEYRGDPQEICKISVKGCKYLSRVNASGEFTLGILRKINKTSSIKIIRSLDFDPYFCEISGLKQLAGALKKLKNSLNSLSMVLRRFTVRDELKHFSPHLSRLNHLAVVKLEFANPQGMLMQDVRDLAKASKKLYCLKSVDIVISGNKELNNIRGLFGLSKNIEKYRLHIYFMEQGHVDDEPARPVGKTKQSRALKAFKHLDFKLALKTGWASFFDGVDVSEGFQHFLKTLPHTSNPLSFSLAFDKLQKPLDLVNEIANVLPQLADLKKIFLEFTNTSLGELEMLTLAKGFVGCKRIEHLTFKILDKAPIPMMDILPFIRIMAKFSTFSSFDLFFRKVFYPEWQSPDTQMILEEIGNIKYVLTKQSLHIQKISLSE